MFIDRKGSEEVFQEIMLLHCFLTKLPVCKDFSVCLQEENTQRSKQRKKIFSGTLRKHNTSEHNHTNTHNSKRTVHRGCHTGEAHTQSNVWVCLPGRTGSLCFPAFILNLGVFHFVYQCALFWAFQTTLFDQRAALLQTRQDMNTVTVTFLLFYLSKDNLLQSASSRD